MTEAEPPTRRRTVLVTRPRQQAVATARRLHAAGHRALIDPLLAIHGVPFTLPEAERIAAILLTSANAAQAFDPKLAALPVLAVGKATAAVARRHGWTDVRAADGDAIGLARLAKGSLEPQAGALIHLSGEEVKAELGELLLAAGYDYRRVVVYRAAAATGFAARTLRALREHELDAALLYSPRSASLFKNLIQREKLAGELHNVAVVCLSAAVAERVRDLPWKGVQVAERRDQDAMLASLEGILRTC
jgi:uroporphyrinogen-III synthase